MTDAWLPLALLTFFIILILTGQPQAHVIVVGARVGSHAVLCDGEAMVYEVEPVMSDSTGILSLPCHVNVHPDEAEWVGDADCGLEWRAE